ncbi:hypothetical protein [Streptomyces lancefieldiae]|uniref:Uncharacterized protein n=1 Tax=Streptomyces lancefieldiae TaxID=3075520 RepID=A0ABU3B411_9ACTN|nr:hypothetical protein [Streptomyces sp. DSM 40712]MDT0616048.1 hypothetical protein [Streptomyces sp. DSM 40712]
MPVDALAANGAPEEGPGGRVRIRTPTDITSSSSYYWPLICRGLASAPYREAGARHGRTDYTHAIERETEQAVTLLPAHLARAG